MASHVMVIFYSFAVFLSMCNLCLTLILAWRKKEKSTRNLLLFLLSFFLWGFLNLIAYYKMHIIVSVSILSYYTIFLNLVYVGMFFFWVRYAVENGRRSVRGWSLVFEIFCVSCVLLWGMDCIFFMDRHYNIVNGFGNIFATVMECLLIVPMSVLMIHGARRSEKLLGLRTVGFGILLALYICINDIRVSFYGKNLYADIESPWAMGPIFCLLINITVLVYLISEFLGIVKSLDENEAHDRMMTIALSQLEDEFNISQREAEVLKLIYMGKGNQEISDELFISVNTTKKHINSIFRKLGVDSRAGLMSKIHLKIDNGT